MKLIWVLFYELFDSLEFRGHDVHFAGISVFNVVGNGRETRALHKEVAAFEAFDVLVILLHRVRHWQLDNLGVAQLGIVFALICRNQHSAY